ncbi:MAG: DUF370 domain-containing protein [Clostridia bacterium]|nr:DUF370 domain-containing protein [Clostridia bacterium]
MFIHIGEGKVLSKKNIIGIFDLETTSISKKTREFLRINEKKGNVEYVSAEIPKTYIITDSKLRKKVYVTQISSQTLQKRAERNDSIGTENQ